jgi:hypothetical protein
MLALRNRADLEQESFIDFESVKKTPTFLAGLFKHTRTDSESTLVAKEDPCNENQVSRLLELPVELLTIIAMHSGFFGAMTLMRTCRKLRQVLTDKNSWADYHCRSADAVEILVEFETRLHQFDRIVFARWPSKGDNTPCLIHYTYQPDSELLGGVSFPLVGNIVRPEFFEDRSNLPCVVADGSVTHSCSECSHYSKQTIEKSTLIQKPSDVSHTFKINSKVSINVVVSSSRGVFGYSNDQPCLTIRPYALNGIPFNKRILSKYLHYTR